MERLVDFYYERYNMVLSDEFIFQQMAGVVRIKHNRIKEKPGSVKITFKELRERFGISLTQISKASYIFIDQIIQFEESNEIFLDQLDAILLAFSNLVGKRFIREDIYYIPQLRFQGGRLPFEGPLPERPAMKEVIEQYQLSPHLISLAADISFRGLEEMMIGRPVEKELMERVSKIIALYIRSRHGVEVEIDCYGTGSEVERAGEVLQNCRCR